MRNERLIPETAKMCRMCDRRNRYDNRCNLVGVSIETQNRRAEKGECRSAAVTGPDRQLNYHKVLGWMQRQDNGQWIFKGMDPYSWDPE